MVRKVIKQKERDKKALKSIFICLGVIVSLLVLLFASFLGSIEPQSAINEDDGNQSIEEVEEESEEWSFFPASLWALWPLVMFWFLWRSFKRGRF